MKKIILILIATAFLSACSKKEIEKPVEEQYNKSQIDDTSIPKKAAENGENLFEQAFNAYDNHNYIKAAELFEKSCNSGYAQGCGALAMLYDRRLSSVAHDLNGIEYNITKAIQWHEKACSRGFAESCLNLGNLYYKGQEVPEDFHKSFQWYQKGCDGDNAEACFKLANVYSHPYISEQSGVSLNYKEAFQLYEKACNGNVADACYNLGMYYHEGREIVQPNQAQAKQLFQKSCDLGNKHDVVTKLACDMYRKLDSTL